MTTKYVRRPIKQAGKVLLVWCPTVADITAPTVAEIEAGVEFQCATDTFDTSGAITKQSNSAREILCDVAAVAEESPEQLGTLELHVFVDPQAYASNAFLQAMQADAEGYLIHREGIDYGTGVAAAQVVHVYEGQVSGDPIPDSATLDDDNSFGAVVAVNLKRRKYASIVAA